MAKIKYVSGIVKKADLAIICNATPILKEYANAGYRVTLRQLHYQFVARGILPNTKATYDKICTAMQHGRMGGLVDWDIIEDRTRVLRSRPSWDDPADILDSCAHSFHVDYWQDQPSRVELWIEKDALLGVIADTCDLWDCPYFSCRGYPSTSELHEVSLRIKRFYQTMGQGFKILYCGDHDPSGLDMGLSIVQTLQAFGTQFEFKRISLNMEQIARLSPPPNPVKDTDSRTKNYRRLYGDQCWELDTLPPQELNSIVETEIISSIANMDDFECRKAEEQEGQEQLRLVGDNFDAVHEWAKRFETAI